MTLEGLGSKIDTQMTMAQARLTSMEKRLESTHSKLDCIIKRQSSLDSILKMQSNLDSIIKTLSKLDNISIEESINDLTYSIEELVGNLRENSSGKKINSIKESLGLATESIEELKREVYGL